MKDMFVVEYFNVNRTDLMSRVPRTCLLIYRLCAFLDLFPQCFEASHVKIRDDFFFLKTTKKTVRAMLDNRVLKLEQALQIVGPAHKTKQSLLLIIFTDIFSLKQDKNT